MGHAVAGSRITDAQGRPSRLGCFLLGSLILHVLVVALWRGEPPAAPQGQSTFNITVLASYGDTPDKAGAEARHQENNATQQSGKSAASAGERAPLKQDKGGKSLPTTERASNLQAFSPAVGDLQRAGTRASTGVKKSQNRAAVERYSQLTERRAPPVQGGVAATPGSNSRGQQQISSAARYRRVQAALQQALLPRFDYPSVARRRGWQGRVRIGLHVAADGALTRIHLLESSGYALLDRAAVKDVNELRSVPAVAQWLDGRDMDVILPVRYQLQNR
jgi:TonB family protein